MIMKKILFWSAVAILSAVSCNKIDVDAPVQESSNVPYFEASVDGADTKTVIDGNKSYWDGTEGIRVFDGKVTNGKVYTAKVEKAERAIFAEADPKVSLTGETYLAVYPENPAGSVTWDGKVESAAKKFWLSGDQVAVAGSYDPVNHIAVAYTETGSNGLQFKNVNSLIKVTVANDNVSEICFYGNSQEGITGNFDVLYNDGEPKASFATGYTKNAYAKITGNIENGQTYYISILPTVFEKGFSIEFVIDGVKYTKKLSSKYTVERNQIINLPVVTFEPEVVEMKTVYMRPTSAWENEKGDYVAWCWGTKVAGSWYKLADTDTDGIYEMSLPVTFENAIFLCIKAGSAADWSNELARTGDLKLPTDDKNCYNGYTNTWGTLADVKAYDPAAIYAEDGWVYLKPNSNWTQANAWFAIYLCNGNAGTKWIKMTKVQGTSYYGAELPAGYNDTKYKNIIFVRMNPSKTALDWGSKWNQSGDLPVSNIVNGKNCCAIKTGQWDCGTNVTWSTVEKLN